MSRTGAQNQARMWAGYARIAAQLGFEYTVFQHSLEDPVNPSKSDTVINCAFSSDVNFVAPQKHDKAAFYLWADGTSLTQFNFLVGHEGTFYIGDMQALLPMQAIKCNKLVSIGRGEYSMSGAIVETVVNYANALPCFMQFTRMDIQKPNISMGQQIGRAITHWDAYIPALDNTIRQDDILTDEADGIQYIVDAPDYTHMGYVCRLRLATV